jgi:hypothetical protein
MSTIASRMNTRTLGPLLLPHLPLPGGRGGLHGSSRGSGDGPWGRPGDAGPRGCRGVTSALLQACLRLQGVPASGRGGVGERVRGERGARRGQFKPRKTANPPRCHLKGTAKATPAAKPAATKCMILLQRMIMLRERARAGDSGQGKGGGRQSREGCHGTDGRPTSRPTHTGVAAIWSAMGRVAAPPVPPPAAAAPPLGAATFFFFLAAAAADGDIMAPRVGGGKEVVKNPAATHCKRNG